MHPRARLALVTIAAFTLSSACKSSPSGDPPKAGHAGSVMSLAEATNALAARLGPRGARRVAVFPFIERGRAVTLFGEYAADKLVVALAGQPGLELVERQRLQAVRAEHDLSVSGSVDDGTAASIGQMAGAETVLVGVLTNAGSSWELSVRELSTTAAKILAAEDVAFSSESVPGGLAGVAPAGGVGAAKGSAERLQLAATSDGMRLAVRRGERLTIKAAGQVNTHPDGWNKVCDIWTGPQGIAACGYPRERAELGGLPFMALVGKLDGPWFLVGEQQVIDVQSDGELTLRVNDWDFRDNAGTLQVDIQR